MIELAEQPRQVSGSRLLDILREHDATSLVDPFMGVPTHLNYLKRHGITVHGGELIDWLVRAGEGLVVNDFTILRDSEVAELVEILPGRIYPTDMFKAWEGVFFSEEQCAYLGVWHSNVHNLRSDGQTGLAVIGLWYAFCYWLQKAQHPDSMPDIAPSELAWTYIRQTERWVCENLKRNTVRRGDWNATLAKNKADAVLLVPPARTSYRKPDARMWMWEAWWQGNPYLNIEHYFRDGAFAGSNDDATYDRAFAALLAETGAYPLAIVQTDRKNAARFEKLVRAARPHVVIQDARDEEVYVIAKR